MEALLVLLPLLFVVFGLLWLILTFHYKRQLEKQQNWKAVAHKHKLSFSLSPPTDKEENDAFFFSSHIDRQIDGTLHNLPLRLRCRIQNAHLNNRTHITEGRVILPSPLPKNFCLQTQGFLTGNGTPTGDKLFDANFVSYGLNPSTQAKLLHPEVRAALLDLQSVASNIKLENQELTWSTNHLIGRQNTLNKMITSAIQSVRALHGHRQTLSDTQQTAHNTEANPEETTQHVLAPQKHEISS